MGLFELVLVALGLSMDAFAVALCKGLGMKRLNWRNGLIIALFFGGFQAVMPFVGWLLGKQFAGYIVSVDHWIAFVLLSFIGGKMLYEVFKPESCPADCSDVINYKELTMLAVATSIDALAVGITFAFLQVSIVPAVLLIGAVTFCLSLGGVAIGHQFGSRLKTKAEIAGGVVLILIGLKILLQHLGVISF